MQTERAELYFQQGSSDKVYHLQLENTGEQWSVQAQWAAVVPLCKATSR
jgi:hypothetical protein